MRKNWEFGLINNNNTLFLFLAKGHRNYIFEISKWVRQ